MRRIAGSLASLVSLTLVLSALVGCTTQEASRTPATPSVAPLKPFAPNVLVVLTCKKEGVEDKRYPLVKLNGQATEVMKRDAVQVKAVANGDVCALVFAPGTERAVAFVPGDNGHYPQVLWGEDEGAAEDRFTQGMSVDGYLLIALYDERYPAGTQLPASRETGKESQYSPYVLLRIAGKS